MKYKRCCKARCTNLWCDTRDQGGCLCVCRLKEWEENVLAQLEGSRFKKDGCIIYVPGKKIVPDKITKANLEAELEEVRAKLKSFEI